MGNYSTFLFARPSFAEGMGRAFDLGNTMSEYNTSQNGELADSRAFAEDWAAVWDDLQRTLGTSASVATIEKAK